MNKVKLSILIPTLPNRIISLFELYSDLYDQIQSVDEDVEIVTCLDNKKVSIGAKRSRMLEQTQGEYFAFVDDDDKVSSDYVTTLLKAFRDNPGVDVVTFDVLLTYISSPPAGLDHLVTYTHPTLSGPCRKRSSSLMESLPNHIHAWRTANVRDVPFPDKQYAEDWAWSRRVNPRANTHIDIPRVLYYYNFNELTSETRP